MEKLIGTKGRTFVWKRSKGSVRVQFDNGSAIFFVSEMFSKDNALTQFLGLETNGVLLEQIEGLTYNLYQMVVQRIGSWYITPMPPPILLGTFNPTPTWIKKEVYDKSIKGELPDNTLYVEALPSDNPFVTNEQWENWGHLDEDSYAQMIKSIWKFKGMGNIWAYSFDYDLNVVDVTTPQGAEWERLDSRLPIDLVFDFNVDPMTCLVCQHNGLQWGKVLKEYRLRNSDIYELLEQIKIDYPGGYFVVTGDASGRNRSAITKGNKTYVIIIKEELNLALTQIKFPDDNPSIANTRMVVNSLFSKHKSFKISSRCRYLIDDLQTIRTDVYGGIDEKQKKAEKLKTHLLDNLRYFTWNYFKTFISFKG